VITPISRRQGLNIVEPVDEEQDGGRRAVVASANWADRTEKNGLEPHSPEVTELVIDLDADLRH
jgi:hypothetical protein